jgi:hypothetical protein
MDRRCWKAFTSLREQYRAFVRDLAAGLPELAEIEQELVKRRKGPVYRIDTPVVYNEALDAIGPRDLIKLILAADNPGRREQAAENRRYLVGPSGKIAETFFRRHPELGIDFRKHVLILNKTPIHTPRTAELGELCRLGGPRIVRAVEESQRAMARLLPAFQEALFPGGAGAVWIIGYSEMKRGGIFETYTGELTRLYDERRGLKDKVFIYRHFSMNQFTIDLNNQSRPGETTAEALERIGAAYRERVLGS